MRGWGLHVIHPTLEVRFTHGDIVAGGAITGEAYAQTPAGVATDEWPFFAGTYDMEHLKLYVNGTLVDTALRHHRLAGNPEMNIGYGGTEPAGDAPPIGSTASPTKRRTSTVR